MRVEVMKVAQQPAMAYDKISLNTAARSGKSGLLLKSLYAFCGRFGLAGSVLALFRDARLACDFLASAQTGPLLVRRRAHLFTGSGELWISGAILNSPYDESTPVRFCCLQNPLSAAIRSVNSSPLLFGGSVLVEATMNSARVLAAPFKKAPCCPEPLKRNGTGNLASPNWLKLLGAACRRW